MSAQRQPGSERPPRATWTEMPHCLGTGLRPIARGRRDCVAGGVSKSDSRSARVRSSRRLGQSAGPRTFRDLRYVELSPLVHPALHILKGTYIRQSAITVIELGLLARHTAPTESGPPYRCSCGEDRKLAQLPRGEYLKPALLGYHHLGADFLWLRLLQVGVKKKY